MERKPWNWVSFVFGIAGALVVLGGAWIALAVGQASADADQERFEACMLNIGFDIDAPPGTYELDQLLLASEVCS